MQAVAQQQPKVWTPQDLFQRNAGTTEQQSKQFPPHKIIGNVHYVGTETLSSYLITGYKAELDIVEGIFTRTLDEQRKAAPQR